MTENTPPTAGEIRQHISDGYQGQDDRTRRREASKAAGWTQEAAARLTAIERAENRGLALSPVSLLSAGYADEAKAAHDRLNDNTKEN